MMISDYKTKKSMQDKATGISKYKSLILMIIQLKIKQKIIRSHHIFWIIHTEY